VGLEVQGRRPGGIGSQVRILIGGEEQRAGGAGIATVLFRIFCGMPGAILPPQPTP